MNRDTNAQREISRSAYGRLQATTDQELDRNQLVGRLMQIREHIKQATTMMGKLSSSRVEGDQGRARKLEQVVTQLQEQEHKYLDLLVNLSSGQRETFSHTRAEQLLSNQRGLESSDDDNVNPGRSGAEEASNNVDLARPRENGAELLAAGDGQDSETSDELRELRKKYNTLKQMLMQQEQLRLLQRRYEALAGNGAKRESPSRNTSMEALLAPALTPAPTPVSDSQILEPTRTERQPSAFAVQEADENVSELDLGTSPEAEQVAEAEVDEVDETEAAEERPVDEAADTAAAAMTSEPAETSENGLQEEAETAADLSEVHQQFGRLQEVRHRLTQLRDLMQYYESQPSPSANANSEEQAQLTPAEVPGEREEGSYVPEDEEDTESVSSEDLREKQR